MQIQKHELRQEQRLRMSPQLLQAIKLMALPIQDLRLTIREEIEKNPALEILDDRGADSYDEVSTQNEEENYFENTSDAGYISSGGSEASDAKQRFLEGVLTKHESLHEHLLWQLKLQVLPEDWYRIGELIIMNLDDNGFHRESPEDLVKEEEKPILKRMIPIIQRFDPTGVCTKGYEEALLVQARQLADLHPLVVPILEQYLQLLEKGKTKEIARALGKKESDIDEALRQIKNLEPLPGRNYTSEEAKYVIPDVRVKIVEGEFFIVLNDEEIPVLGINPFFDQMKDEKEKELKQYVSAKISDAKWFIRSINQRNETLLKTSRAIVEFQRDFFRRGQKYLVPLTLKDISESIGVHEATVSRITTGKYIQTEWGIFELKYFFTNSISGSGSQGSRFSKEGVKQIVKEIIEREPKNLSDNKIVEILANRGIKIARRTIAKYRKELGIFSSFDRKQ